MLKFIRWFVGNILIALNAIFSPKGIKRTPDEQSKVDVLTSKMSLYQFAGCPFCIKVRREMKRLSLNIELRDAINNQENADDLVKLGGKRKVPCLKISNPDGSDQWMYESKVIVNHLQQFA
ncbi:hypothetical protein BVY03_04425 [bacterium K02(2017)]|nr:hypothetical protein BVY03_04425 [bacterium K02(2017)]